MVIERAAQIEDDALADPRRLRALEDADEPAQRREGDHAKREPVQPGQVARSIAGRKRVVDQIAQQQRRQKIEQRPHEDRR